MSVYNAELHCMMSSPSVAKAAGPVTASATADAPATDQDGESFFDHIWNVINPLQHLPVVGTVYRAVTGEQIGDLEKIAGDTLYGGLWGAVSSVADVAFEGITGKSAEETVLALFKGDDASGTTAIASNAPSKLPKSRLAMPVLDGAPALPSAELPALPGAAPTAVAAAKPDSLDIAALSGALTAKGVDGDTANRALYAYRRSMGMTASLN